MSSTHDLHINHHQSLRKKHFADVIKVLTGKRIKHNHTCQAKQSIIEVPSTRIRIFRIQKLSLPTQKYLRTHLSFSNHFRSSSKRILLRLKMEIFLYTDWLILLGTEIHLYQRRPQGTFPRKKCPGDEVAIYTSGWKKIYRGAVLCLKTRALAAKSVVLCLRFQKQEAYNIYRSESTVSLKAVWRKVWRIFRSLCMRGRR